MVVADLRAEGDAVTARKRSRVLLAMGALLGLALAVHGIVGPARSTVPKGAVAMVGDVPISVEDYTRALAAVASDRRTAIDPALQRHVLDRLVDEELLVQAALANGIALRDPTLRGQIAAAMIDAIIGAKTAPSDDVLRAYLASHATAFARNGRVRVEALWFDRKARALAARTRLLAGEKVLDADPPALVVPSGAIPQVKLSDYLGPVVAGAVAVLPPGGITEPIESAGGVWVVRLVERVDGELPPFESVREQVLADYRREQDDEALRRFLERRRRETRVAIRELP